MRLNAYYLASKPFSLTIPRIQFFRISRSWLAYLTVEMRLVASYLRLPTSILESCYKILGISFSTPNQRSQCTTKVPYLNTNIYGI
jgi:hypothetical protein